MIDKFVEDGTVNLFTSKVQENRGHQQTSQVKRGGMEDLFRQRTFKIKRPSNFKVPTSENLHSKIIPR